MKKLIPALCMLLVAACLMGTSTYAWFTANKEVTAEGMQIKAVSDGGLAIASYKGEDGNTRPDPADFATTATLAWSNARRVENNVVTFAGLVKPVSTNNGTDWYVGSAKTAESSAVNEEGYKKLNFTAESNPDNTADYYLYSKWDVKSLDESGEDYDLVVRSFEIKNFAAANTVAAELETSLRIAFKYGNTWKVFAPNRTSTSGLTVVSAQGVPTEQAPLTVADTAIAAAANTVKGTNTITSAAVVLGTVDSTATLVEVFIYFEGMDPNCMSKNAFDLKSLEISFSLSAE